MAAKLARVPRSQPSLSAPPALMQVGDLLAGKYRVERVIGEGGMGVVVAARHELLDQHVAVKLLYHDSADREAQSRLVREARACAKLQSDHVARVIDVDTGPDGLPFIVMELLEGTDLGKALASRGPLPSSEVTDWLLQALEGLAHAHARNIVHRDLKPSNLFLARKQDGTAIVKILDFGISKSSEDLEQGLQRWRSPVLTAGSTVMGSPPYMSPEQVRSSKSVDHRTDIWSVGVCLYELLSNTMPFGSGALQATFKGILEGEPSALRERVPDVPEGLDHVIKRCLEKDPAQRFANVADLSAALEPFGSGAWQGASARIEATLSRGFEESGSRRSISVSRSEALLQGSGQPMAIPASPRPPESNQECLATANTVVRRFTLFETRSLWLVGVPALLGCAIAAASIYHARAVATEGTRAPSTRAAAAIDTEGPSVAALAAPGVVEAKERPVAVPPAPPTSQSPPVASQRAVAKGGHGPKRAPAGSPGSPAPPGSPGTVGSQATELSRPSLPAGLPRERR